ncbi:SusC/RagA family TonB-linked outer membrane protein [Terrimonas sp.]|uniref:SusC/RagA family TonB-linked outer membrane protein n=1 Tax=Terrimonas sp. TaxID=1914338 RepID=UPI000D512BC9|nr:TonB-dependent receptor [Terrimonas sp.]PVD49885.1 SusC/RagA family TonB-linked outer membrane protein [Terrimonas sp.]
MLFAILFCFSQISFSQSNPVNVTGKVTDSTGNGIANVTVTEKGKKRSVITDGEGLFSIAVASQNSVLVFTSVGFVSQERKVGDQAALNITLQASNTSMEEVVVVGYGSRKKQSLTGSVATVTADDISRVHGGSTVSTVLAGKLPGVSFRMPDGRPGASANVQIRGMGDALFVIDGIQQDAGQFNNLAPNDIESISVLKDASAAIYGIRAANGVVVVTTKRGRLNSGNRINFDSYVGFQNWMRFPDVLTNSYDFMRYRAEAEINRYGSTTITPEEIEKYKQGTEPGYQSFNWKDFIIKPNAPINSFNLNATGGTDKLNYYLSATNLYQNSPLGREYLFKRTNIQSNVNAKVANGLKVGMMINGRIETRENPGVPGGDDYWLARFAILRNTPLERPYANDNPEYLNDIKHNETNWAYLNYKNAGKLKDDWRVLQANFTAEYDIPWVKGLSINGMYSYYLADNLMNNQEFTYKTYTYDAVDDVYKHTGGSTNPWRERNQVKQNNITTQLQVNYKRSFGLHDIAVTFVNERISNSRIRNWIHSVPSSNALPLIYFNTADTYTDEDSKEARIGYVGRFNYGYDNKYFLEVAGRRDASYIFPPDNRVGYFPSVSAGWRITEESFVRNLLGNSRVISDIKLRASYGILGDDGTRLGLGAFRYIEGYDYNQGIAILDGIAVVGSRDRGVPTTNITWLKSRMTDVGVDFALFNNKLTGTFDYFYRKRSGLITAKNDVLVPSEIGYTLPMENLESDAQYGQEFSLAYNGQVRDVAIRIGGNVSYSRSKFLQRYNPLFFNSWDQYRNSSVNRYTKIAWGYEVVGQFQSFEEINKYPVNIDGQGNRTLLPGDLIYKDFNNDGMINDYDQRPIGYAGGSLPNINYGLSIGLAYKGFDFTADFSGGAGYSWYQDWETRWAFQNDGNLNTIFTDRWHRTDMYDLNSEWIPGKYPANRFNESGHSNNNRMSSYWAHNLKYLRARTIELGYSLPSHWISKVKMQRARIYANVYNLFSIDNLKEFELDPEVNDENGLQFPQSTVFNFGVNLSF